MGHSQIVQAISSWPQGKVFHVNALTDLGSRAALDKTIFRLHRDGYITRIATGIYKVGQPDTEDPFELASQILEAKAKWTKAEYTPCGQFAAWLVGLTDERPKELEYFTSGSPGIIRVGGLTIRLKQASLSKLVYANTPIGLCMAAMWHLGKERMSSDVVHKIKLFLTEDQFTELKFCQRWMPEWMGQHFRPSRDELEMHLKVLYPKTGLEREEGVEAERSLVPAVASNRTLGHLRLV